MSAHDDPEAPFVVVLGIAQDGGYPQAGCGRACCEPAWADPRRRRLVACLGILDPPAGWRWLVDATPDFREQLRRLDAIAPVASSPAPDLAGILLTHGHIGHYTGLIHLGREVMNARGVPLCAMPRMAEHLRANGPWDQLVREDNVALRPPDRDGTWQLSPRVGVTPFLVPHRAECSETVGLRIAGPSRRVLYLPDIDAWDPWEVPLAQALREVDRAYLDGTFYDAGELPQRDPSEVPHPPIAATMRRLADLPAGERAKVRFIHLNHTNPALQPGGPARQAIAAAGFGLAEEGERFVL
jgi:pyrroloquinoline quinone biosynthesis protein B